jgi:hypothetical protein
MAELGWVVVSGSSNHMTRMRSVFLSVSEIGSDFLVKNGACTRHAVKGVGIWMCHIPTRLGWFSGGG